MNPAPLPIQLIFVLRAIAHTFLMIAHFAAFVKKKGVFCRSRAHPAFLHLHDVWYTMETYLSVCRKSGGGSGCAKGTNRPAACAYLHTKRRNDLRETPAALSEGIRERGGHRAAVQTAGGLLRAGGAPHHGACHRHRHPQRRHRLHPGDGRGAGAAGGAGAGLFGDGPILRGQSGVRVRAGAAGRPVPPCDAPELGAAGPGGRLHPHHPPHQRRGPDPGRPEPRAAPVPALALHRGRRAGGIAVDRLAAGPCVPGRHPGDGAGDLRHPAADHPALPRGPEAARPPLAADPREPGRRAGDPRLFPPV